MVLVNPSPQPKLPKAIREDPQALAYFNQLEIIIRQLRERTGGDIDTVENAAQNITALNSRVSRNLAKINAIEEIRLTTRIVSSNATAKAFEVLICENSTDAVITLDSNALLDDVVHIKRTSGEVRVNGDIDGESFKIINIPNYSMHLIFNGVEWNEI